MTRKQLLKKIEAHCRRTKESAYRFGARVMHDKAFVWKLRNGTRQPYQSTIDKIMAEIEVCGG